MSFKEKIMNNMMDKQFSNMSSEEKQQMMDTMMEKFFSNMSDDEKENMMSNMMPGMMKNMMGSSKGNPMMGMMSMMAGSRSKGKKGNTMPWDMCKEMISGIKETSNMARFATPELRNLFDEWCSQIEEEMVQVIKETKLINVSSLAEKFNLSEESIKYLLNNLANKNLIDYKIE